MSTDRDALSSRVLPFMTLSNGDEASLTAPPPPMPHYLNAEGRALARFAVEGNVVSMVLSSDIASYDFFSNRTAQSLVELEP